MQHRKHLTAGVVAIAAIIGTGSALAATSEHANLLPKGAPAGYLKIDPKTCKFIHHEIDVRPTPGERYARAEDSRDDVKLSCLTKRQAKMPTLKYVRVLAVGTGQTVTAACPAGYNVVGGGSQHEVAGSYPATDDTWTVTRDHLSPKQLDVRAVCVRLAS